MSEGMIDPFVKMALEKLLDPTRSFYVNDFDDICRLLNVIPPKGYRDRLALIHCVKYRDMDEDLRQEVGRMIYETLNTPGFNIEIKQASLGSDKVVRISGGDK